MRVRIRYQRRDEATAREIEMSPEEYFDPLNPGETISVRSVPKLLNTYEYTLHSADQLAWTVVEITDGLEFWRVRTQLVDGMRSLMHHSQDSDGSEEIIHQTELIPSCWHTIRILKQAGKLWAVVMDSLTVEQPGALVADKDFRERQSFEELKAFGNVR
jgi:hypothetical protein